MAETEADSEAEADFHPPGAEPDPHPVLVPGAEADPHPLLGQSTIL